MKKGTKMFRKIKEHIEKKNPHKKAKHKKYKKAKNGKYVISKKM